MGKSKYENVNYKVVEYLGRACGRGFRPWHSEDSGKVNKPLHHNGQPYNGINIITLWIKQMEEGYS